MSETLLTMHRFLIWILVLSGFTLDSFLAVKILQTRVLAVPQPPPPFSPPHWGNRPQIPVLYDQSDQVKFYSLRGEQIFRYVSPVLYGNALPDTLLCDFTSGGWSSGSNPSHTYNITVLNLGADATDANVYKLAGRLVKFTKPQSTKSVVICSVSEYSVRRPKLYWNYIIYVGLNLTPSSEQPDNNNNITDSSINVVNFSPEDVSKSISLQSSKEVPERSESVTITCSLEMDSSLLDFFVLRLYRNKAIKSNDVQDSRFISRSNSAIITHRLLYTYTPSKFLPEDKFECRAHNPLTQYKTSKSLTVKYQSGVEFTKIVNVSGKSINDPYSVGKTDIIKCVTNTEVPEVSFVWTVMIQDQMVNISNRGNKLQLAGVNLFYNVCCTAANTINNQTYSANQCINFRGNSVLKTVIAYDKENQRQLKMTCDARSNLGILGARLSSLVCNKVKFINDSNNSSICLTKSCKSQQVKSFIEESCKKNTFCDVNAGPLMSTFLMRAIRKEDDMPDECFDVQGLTKVEVDYFCTTPRAVTFTASGIGKSGLIQYYAVPKTGCYDIVAKGAAGGNHTTRYGMKGGGTWLGGKGAIVIARYMLKGGENLSIVVGQSGGNSSEISPRNKPSIEDNAGTGGGGGSFVYTNETLLYVAAGGGGGASYDQPGVPGQSNNNGSNSSGPVTSHIGKGGINGLPGNTNLDAASYHGGVGAGWFGSAKRRRGLEHGGPGGSYSENWTGGLPGGMNPGAEGGFGGGGGGSEDNGASGGGGGYSGGGAGSHERQAGGGGGSYCIKEQAEKCDMYTGGSRRNSKVPIVRDIESMAGKDGVVQIFSLGYTCPS